MSDRELSSIKLIPLDQVASRLGYKCIKSVKRLIQRGELPSPVPRGGELCLVEAELNAWFERKLRERVKDAAAFAMRRSKPLDDWKESQDGSSNVGQAAAA